LIEEEKIVFFDCALNAQTKVFFEVGFDSFLFFAGMKRPKTLIDMSFTQI